MDTEISNNDEIVKKPRQRTTRSSSLKPPRLGSKRKPKMDNFVVSSPTYDDATPKHTSIDFQEADLTDTQGYSNSYQLTEETWTPNKNNLPVSPTTTVVPEPATNIKKNTSNGSSNEPASSGTSADTPTSPARRYPNNNQNQRRDFQNNNNNNNNNFQRQRQHNNNLKNNKAIRIGQLSTGNLKTLECFSSFGTLDKFFHETTDLNLPDFDFNEAYDKRTQLVASEILSDPQLIEEHGRSSHKLLEYLLTQMAANKTPIVARGVLETTDGGDGLLVYNSDNYRIRPQSAFISKILIQKYGLRRGQDIVGYIYPPTQGATCPFVVAIRSVLDMPPTSVSHLPKFKDLVPYYPTERLFLESSTETKWDNISMRIIDILTPIGLGQRGLIVAPPRTGKTVLLQGIANAISQNRPDVKLMILLIDERPEEVTDFKRQVPRAEIISSTFDESPDSHIHAADMIIDKARRYVEAGKHVVILLDSITRLARAHNTEQPSSGKLLSGGVDANALQAPKKFFGAARNIEGGGSLTILATALIETGSKMDDVIFEEFKGTGNMELHLDRSLADKRTFPSLNIEKSGTRKEELLYHPDEMEKVYTLRRAMKDVPLAEAMEMLIQRMKKTKSNTEFLLCLNR